MSRSGSSDPSSGDPNAADFYTARSSIAGPSKTGPSSGGPDSGSSSIDHPNGDTPNSGGQNTADPGNGNLVKDSPPKGTSVVGDLPVDSIASDPPAHSPEASSNKETDPESDFKAISVAVESPVDPVTSDLHPGYPQKVPAEPKVPEASTPQKNEISRAQTQISGTIINIAVGRLGPEIDGPATMSLPPQSIITIGAQTFMVNPTGFKVNNAAISPGGTAQAIDGTILSCGQSGIIAIGSSTISFTCPSATPVEVVAGKTFAPNPSAFPTASTTISAGGPAVTVNGTIISLQPSGTLFVGSSTIPLVPSSSPTTFPSDTDIDALDINVQSSFVVVDGATLSAAAAGVTISGEVVSLEAGGKPSHRGTGRLGF